MLGVTRAAVCCGVAVRRYTSKGAYEVDFDLMYEPYVVIPRTAPRYDERFVGYGNDKVSHAYELFLARFRFVVLPNVFLIHMEHPPPQWLCVRAPAPAAR